MLLRPLTRLPSFIPEPLRVGDRRRRVYVAPLARAGPAAQVILQVVEELAAFPRRKNAYTVRSTGGARPLQPLATTHPIASRITRWQFLSGCCPDRAALRPGGCAASWPNQYAADEPCAAHPGWRVPQSLLVAGPDWTTAAFTRNLAALSRSSRRP